MLRGAISFAFAGWNMFFFLWGVFRGKKEKCPDPLNKNKPLPASNFLPNMGRVFSTREDFYNENPSNRESSINCPSSRMQSCMKVGYSSPLIHTCHLSLALYHTSSYAVLFFESHMPFIFLL